MNTKFRYIVLTMLVALLLGSVPAHASDDIETSSTQLSAEYTKTLRITKYARGINRACPAGSDKLYVLRVFVAKDSPGTFVDGNLGVGEIVQKNDRQINSDDYVVPIDYRESDFVFFAPHRKSRLKLDPAENSVTVQVSERDMRFRMGSLRRDCMERYGPGTGH